MKRSEYVKAIEKSKIDNRKRMGSSYTGKHRSNGTGAVINKGYKNRPYVARVAVGSYKSASGRTQIKYKSLGCFKTHREAEEALEEFLRFPYDMTSSVETFQDLYEAWSKDYFAVYTNPSSLRTIRSAYSYCTPIYDMPIRKITIGTIKDVMQNGYRMEDIGKEEKLIQHPSLGTQERIKSLCNMMFDYAEERNLIATNPARAFKVTYLLAEIDKNAKSKKPFTEDQVRLMWKHVDEVPYLDMILIGIYTGFRPQELCSLEIKNVNIEEKWIMGGMKTENGRDRIIPIHPLIFNLVNNRYQESQKLGNVGYLFLSERRAFRQLSYDEYYKKFEKAMNALGMEGYSPHCTRHTFSTQAEICGVMPRANKLIMGHSVQMDVTEKHYKHTNLEYLREEISKLTFHEEGQ